MGKQILATFCSLLLLCLYGCSDGSGSPGRSGGAVVPEQVVSSCARGADEASRLATARALVTVDAASFESLIEYWAEDVTYREPVLTSSGRQEMREYLAAMFSGSAYGFPLDRAVRIKDELHGTRADGQMTYMATLEWTGSIDSSQFRQTGMSILKFRAGEGCPYYHRDYYSEGDSWWNVPAFRQDVDILRNVYISLFGLAGRCFDDDRDGYSKYQASLGCPRLGLDCNDFVRGINPGAMEIPGNGIDEDCNPFTPIDSPDPQLQGSQ